MSEIFKTHKTYIILCEGSSEYAYIQILNRILNEHNISIVLNPVLLRNGHFATVKNKVEEYTHKDRKNLKVWVDKDIYTRNEQNNQMKYLRKKQSIPDFLFTTYNFEDFFIMHLDDNIIIQWEQKLIKRNHFNMPLISDEYIALLKNSITLFKKYQKGVIPCDITLDNIKQAYKTHQATNIKFKSDLLDFIHENVISLL